VNSAMFCGCGGKSRENAELGSPRIEDKDKSMKRVMQITRNGNGSRLIFLYKWWPVEGAPVEITVKGEKEGEDAKRKSWPLKWSEVEKALRDLHTLAGATTGALMEKDIAAIHAETVGNEDKPWLTEENMTWPGIQNLFRESFKKVYGKEFKDVEEGEDWWALNSSLSLAMKKPGLTKKINELGEEKTNELLWKLYTSWPNPRGAEVEVTRLNRKKNIEAKKETWPLKWPEVAKLLKECDLGEFEIELLKVGIFELQADTHVHQNCTPDEVCWPDLQQVFRHYISPDEGWSDELSEKWVPLAYWNTLRLKIDPEVLKETLVGSWRMACIPLDKKRGAPFSYGIVIKEVDLEKWTFKGRARIKEKYKVKDGEIQYDKDTQHCTISYKELWADGCGGWDDEDALKARVKSNAKFQCISESNFDQKATHEDANLPKGTDPRIGIEAPDGVKQYYVNDAEAADFEQIKVVDGKVKVVDGKDVSDDEN